MAPTPAAARASGRTQRGRPRGEHAADGAREEQRSEDVRAAALVLLRPILAVLVRPDGDVLGAVVLGEVRAAQRHGGRADGQSGRDGLLASAGENLLARTRRRPQRAPDHGRRPRRGAGTAAAPREGGAEPRAEARRPRPAAPGRAGAGSRSSDRAQRLLPGGDLQRPVLAAHGAGPVAGPVDEHPVAERHPPEPNLAPRSPFECTYHVQEEAGSKLEVLHRRSARRPSG